MSHYIFVGEGTDLITRLIKSNKIKTVDLKRHEFSNNNVLHEFNSNSFYESINILVDISANIHDCIWELICILDFCSQKNIYIDKLILPYFPYSRSNKTVDNSSSGLFSFIKILNNYQISKIITLDPHFGYQDLTLSSKLNIISFFEIFNNELRSFINNSTIIVAPDKGAIQKVKDIIRNYGVNGFQLSKTRHNHTEIATVSLESQSDQLLDDCSNIIIVDDEICSGNTILKTIELIRDIRQDIIIDVFATHCFIPENRIIFLPFIRSLTSTNTVNNKYNDKKIRIIDVSGIFLG